VRRGREGRFGRPLHTAALLHHGSFTLTQLLTCLQSSCVCRLLVVVPDDKQVVMTVKTLAFFWLLFRPSSVAMQTIAAAFSHKSPFAAPLEKQDELERIKAALAAPAAATAAEAAAAAAGGKGPAAAAARAGGLAAGQQSDQLLLIAAYEMWRLTGLAAGDKAAAQVGILKGCKWLQGVSFCMADFCSDTPGDMQYAPQGVNNWFLMTHQHG